jgi:hypothetical protein
MPVLMLKGVWQAKKIPWQKLGGGGGEGCQGMKEVVLVRAYLNKRILIDA